MNVKKSELFKVLSDETRLRLLNLFLLSKRPLCVCELANALIMPQYQISKHLTVLKYMGFIENQRQGKWMYYSLVKDNSVNNQLFIFLSRFLKDQQFEQDWQYLKMRLSLRKNGRCIIGSVATDELETYCRKN